MPAPESAEVDQQVIVWHQVPFDPAIAIVVLIGLGVVILLLACDMMADAGRRK